MSHDVVSRINGGSMASSSGTATVLSRGTRRLICEEVPSSITLSVPRPDHQRANNVYVDTPFPHKIPPRRPPNPISPQRPSDVALVHSSSSRSSFPRQQIKKKEASHDSSTLQKKKYPNVISTQPITFTKDVPEEDSIICSRCGRCKCDACTSPKQAGGVWLCGGKFHCSPKTAVEYLSCLCCVRGLFYHCGKDIDEETTAVDRPCSCRGPNTLLRWTCLAAACIPLPCLMCYWPLEGFRRLFEGTYSRFRCHGCRCDDRSPKIPKRLSLPKTPEKRLLQDCV